MSKVKIACFGDVVGKPGRAVLRSAIAELRAKGEADFVIANGENASGGLSLEPAAAVDIKECGVDVITLGDHTWHSKELGKNFAEISAWCIRPENYPEGCPGSGATVVEVPKLGLRFGVMNLIGRVFSPLFLDCPFRAADRLLAGPLKECDLVVCDMHAEATSEKFTMGRYLDGRVAAVFGTHTHVQTADEGVLPGGSGYITDIGMCGSIAGVIGMDPEVAVRRFVTGMPHGYRLCEEKPWLACGAVFEIDTESKRCVGVRRVRHLAIG